MKEEESGAPLSKVTGIKEIEMARCFNVSTNSGVVYLVHYLPPFDRKYLKVTYPYIGGDVDELIRGMVAKAVLKYCEDEVTTR